MEPHDLHVVILVAVINKRFQRFIVATCAVFSSSIDIAEGYSPSILTEMRVALIASRAFSLNYTRNLPAGYTPLTLAEGFYMATMGGAEGTQNYI